ncbi:MAG: hypothetical protein ACLGPL_06675 [Acidobacteriota bacterium]
MGEQVKGIRKVAIIGSQLVISAIGASLHNKPGVEIQAIKGSLPSAFAKLEDDPPGAIVFDLAEFQPLNGTIPLMRTHPTLLLIGVDLARNRMLVLCGRESRLLTAEDLVQAIQMVAPK